MENAATDQVVLTASAAKRVAEIIAAEGNPNLKLRVSVLGGGCSGFQYSFGLEENPQDDDMVVERDGVEMLVDQVSLPFLMGSEVDYVEDLIGASFQVRNPNATSSCGCGQSFAI